MDRGVREDGYRKVLLAVARNVERAAATARSTRAPWAIRNLIRVREKGLQQIHLLHALVFAALVRADVPGPFMDLTELMFSRDPHVNRVANIGVTLFYAQGTYLDRVEELIAGVIGGRSVLALEAPLLAIWLYSLAIPIHQRRSLSELRERPPPEPLSLTPSIQPNAPSA